MKEIKKTEMEKEAKEIKNRFGPRGNDLAQHQIQPIAQLIKPEPVPPLSLFPSPTGGTHLSASSPPPFPLFPLWKRKLAGVNAPLIPRE
jgi:hypothetical protein